MSGTPTFESMLVIGRIARPQGRHGELLTECLSDQPGRFDSLEHVFVETADGAAKEERVTKVWPHKGRYVLKLEGVDSIDDAERLRGRRLGLAESGVAALPAGTFYHHQLRGLRVIDEQGTALGVVEDLLETGAALVLVVRGVRGELLVPFAESFIVSVRLAQGELVVHLLESIDDRG